MDYTVSEVEATRKVLQTKINDLMREFYQKYHVGISLYSRVKKYETESDTEGVSRVNIIEEHEVCCYM